MKLFRIILYVVIVHTLFGCKQSELIYSYPNYLLTTVSVDLSETDYTFEDDLLSYSVIFYPIDDGIMPLDELEPKTFRMQQENDFNISISPGDYKVVMYSDYSGQNAFYSKDSYDEIYCEAQSLATIAAGSARSEEITYAAEPDPMVVANMDLVTIEDHGHGTGLSGQVVTFNARQVTTRFSAKVWLTNPGSISSYSGYIGSVDSRYYITQATTNFGGYAIAYTDENSGIVKLDETNSLGESIGYLYIDIDMFGFTQSSSTKYTDASAASMTRALNDVAEGDAYIYIGFSYPGVTSAATEFWIDISSYINDLEMGDEGSVTIEIGSVDTPEMILPEMIYNSGDSDDDGGFNVDVGGWDDENNFVLDFSNGTISK